MKYEDPMQLAIALAKKAKHCGEVPVGAVIVKNGKIIGKGFNRREKLKNALWHAEIVAINSACKKIKSWRLNDCVMYVTLEPCMMCLGACINARISKIVFGAFDLNSQKVQTRQISLYNHNILIQGGYLQDECSSLLKDFFKSKRNQHS